MGFLFVPINLSSYIGMPPEKSGNVAGLVNFTRNIGSSVGTSMVTTLIARRSQLHQQNLVANIAPGHRAFAAAVAGMTARSSASGASTTQAARQAYALVYRAIIGQATTLAYIDTYMVLAVGAAIMFFLSFALKKNQPGGQRVVLD
jgi:DHA2 family multidrug resistance protein